MEDKENLNIPEKKEVISREAINKKLGETKEVFESGFMDPGDPYGIEVLYKDISASEWELLNDKDKNDFLKNLGLVLGVDILNFSGEDIISKLPDSGVKGEKTEGGMLITTLKTNNPDFPNLRIHISELSVSKSDREYYLSFSKKEGGE